MLDKLGTLLVPTAGVTSKALGAATSAAGGGFADLVKSFANQSIDATSQGETASTKAIDKDAELVDVVSAVSNAEVTLDTVVTLRDRVIQAYQEIIRMPV